MRRVGDALRGEVAIVTGGASGIGHATCLLFGAEGASVGVVDIDGAAAEQVAQRIVELGGRAVAVRADIALSADCRRSVEQVHRRRNSDHVGAARGHLVINPGPRSISGKNTQGPPYHFDSGTFLGTPVSLGELRTGGKGRLLVFGGHGISSTPIPNNLVTTFANNHGWHDDVADGPVTATVIINGKSLPVTPAWVIVAPPNYAPGINAIVTLDDVALQAWLDGHPEAPQPVSFTQHIHPILQRFDHLQWVNQGFYEGYGWKGQEPLLDPTTLATLSRNDAGAATARTQIFGRFRNPDYHSIQENAWPRIYGDSFDQPPAYPQQYLAVTREQYRCLTAWSEGNFTADWNPEKATASGSIESLPLPDQPRALDIAALTACSGGPFHPGVEATWPMRQPSLYSGLGRLRHRLPNDPPEPDYGDILTPAAALGPNGPLHRCGPGDVTRWMACPWQTDTSSCGSAYPNATTAPSPLPDLPTFWPAAVPNKVLTQQAYLTLMRGGIDDATRLASFRQRVAWGRQLSMDFSTRINQFVTLWSQMGIIEQHPGDTGDSLLPPVMYVEDEILLSLPSVEATDVAGGGSDQPTLVEDLPAQPLVHDWRARK